MVLNTVAAVTVWSIALKAELIEQVGEAARQEQLPVARAVLRLRVAQFSLDQVVDVLVG
ncbi:hypothetical protein D3C84_847040 [compost metagenome]|jgi:hypothetical protein